MSLEEKIKIVEDYFRSQRKLALKLRYKAEALEQVWKDSYPHYSEIARTYTTLFTLHERQCEVNEFLFKAVIYFQEWRDYFRKSIDYLETMILATTTEERKSAKEKVKTLEKRLKNLEEFKPVLEHLKRWLNAEAKREKQRHRLGVV